MSDISPVLSLPLIQSAQAQKHVTHNEALQVLDAVVQLVVVAVGSGTPPAAPVSGARYIVGASANGAWVGHTDEIAVFAGGAWFFIPPQPGWRAQVLTPKGVVVFDATAGWENAAAAPVQTTPQLGINATADTTNRLSVSAPATLLSHAGAGHQLKINKAAAGDTASLLYQTGFSGRAEMGLAGEDMFCLKVSADGANWTEALRAALDTGQLQIPHAVAMAGPVTGAAVQQDVHDTTDGRLLRTGAFGWGQARNMQISVALNAALSSGVHQFAPTDPDKPVATGGAVLVIRYASQWLSQIVFAANTSGLWLRRTQDNGTTWSAWAPLTPNGGSNTNGSFTQFADGTMTCRHRLTTSAAGTGTWIFPAAFANADTQVSLTPLGTGATFATVSTVDTTTCGLHSFTASGTAVAAQVMMTATGRWT